MAIVSDRGYLLHQRPYRETSIIADVFSASHGKVSLVYKGVRAATTTAKRNRSMLQPFSELSLSWSGRSELKTLRQCEILGSSVMLEGQSIYAGMYINELLQRLLKPGYESDELYCAYQSAIDGLQSVAILEGSAALESVLRLFEMTLLDVLGYAIDFGVDSDSGEPVVEDGTYSYDVLRGFSRANEIDSGAGFSGEVLMQVARRDFRDAATRRCAKRVMRLALAELLGDRPLATREFFVAHPQGDA